MLPAVTTGRGIAKSLSRVKADTIQYFTRDEMNMILSDDLRTKDPDAYFFATFLWRTGARISETLSVRVKDVDTTNKVIRIKTLKRRDGHIRTIPIHDDFLGHLFVYLNRRRLTYEDKLFPFTRKTGWTWVVSACEAAGYGGERAHPHTFRHSFAIHMLANGVPITAVQEMLGHAELANTWVYTKILGLDTRRYVDNVKF